MTTRCELLYKKYKFYGFNENITTLNLLKPMYDHQLIWLKSICIVLNIVNLKGFI